MTTTNNIYVNIYLTNLGKYTEGYLIGKWITLSTAINWKEELESIDVKDGTDYEEFFITDFGSNANIKVNEYMSISELEEMAEKIEELNNTTDIDIFKAILTCASDFDEAYNVAINGDYIYYDDVNDETDLGHALVDEGFFKDNITDEKIKMYLDYESIGRDYMINVNGSFSDNGFIALY